MLSAQRPHYQSLSSLLPIALIAALVQLQPVSGQSGAEARKSFAFSPQQESHRHFHFFERWMEEDAQGTMPRPNATLCVGSSSMRGWRTIHSDLAPLEILHRGFGGSTMAQVNLFQEFFGHYEAARILVYQGDNDLVNSDRVDHFLENCRTFVEYIHALRDDTEFYFISIKPSIARAHRTVVYHEANEALEAWCETDSRLHFIDVFTPMLDKNGEPRAELLRDDKLHMNAEGYAVWTEATRKALGLD